MDESRGDQDGACVLVRAATPDDVPAVTALEEDSLGPDAWSEGLVREGVTGTVPTVSYLVVEAEGQVVGHAVTSSAGDIAELQRIAVSGDHRRRGYASALLHAALDAARTEADRMLLEVREDNESALAFYAAHDFVEVDRRPRYYADGATAVILRRALGRGCGSGTMAP